MSNRKVQPKERICPVCKGKFLVGGRGRKQYKTILCSIKCARLARFRRGAKCNALSKEQAAYIAGFLDGEGTVMIVLRKANSNYSLRVALAQSSKARQVLDWVREVTGIGASVNKNRSSINHDMGLTWACSGQAASGLLEQILPYLIVKMVQAEIAIAFQKRLSNPADKANRVWQREAKEKMALLNHRGIQGNTPQNK